MAFSVSRARPGRAGAPRATAAVVAAAGASRLAQDAAIRGEAP